MENELRIQILDGYQGPRDKELLQVTFTHFFFEAFIGWINMQLPNNVFRPGKSTQHAAFNALEIDYFFAQVNIIYEQLNVRHSGPNFDLNEAMFTSGHDLCSIVIIFTSRKPPCGKLCQELNFAISIASPFWLLQQTEGLTSHQVWCLRGSSNSGCQTGLPHSLYWR